MSRISQKDRTEAIERLRKILKPGDTVYTILRHVSKFGMSRDIDLYKIDGGEPMYLSGYAANALGESRSKDQGIRVGGCGMDMGFHLVYNLSRTLWPNGHGCIGKGERWSCPSNDHSNGDRDYTPEDSGDIRWTEGSIYQGPVVHHHSDGGYALRHRWL